MGRFCYNCGAPLSEDTRFCPGCGSPQQAAEPAPAVVAPAPVAPQPAAPAPVSTPVSSTPAPVSPVPAFVSGAGISAEPSSGASVPKKKTKGVFRWIAVILLFCLSAGALCGVGFEIYQHIKPYDSVLKGYMRLRYGGEYDMTVCSRIFPNDYWEEMQDSSVLQESLSNAQQNHRYEISAETYGRDTEYSYKVIRKEKLPDDHEFFDRLDDKYDIDADQGYEVTVEITLSGSKGSKVFVDTLCFLADGKDWFYFDGYDFLP